MGQNMKFLKVSLVKSKWFQIQNDFFASGIILIENRSFLNISRNNVKIKFIKIDFLRKGKRPLHYQFDS